MDPIAEVTIKGKTSIYKLDVESKLYSIIIKQLMTYTMTQDKNDLPIALPLALLLPKKMKDKIAKLFLNESAQIVYHLNESWKFVWESLRFMDGCGWYFDGEKVKGYEDQI